eukprot:6212745-Pleurochrysis_carterae.AAC.3
MGRAVLSHRAAAFCNLHAAAVPTRQGVYAEAVGLAAAPPRHSHRLARRGAPRRRRPHRRYRAHSSRLSRPFPPPGPNAFAAQRSTDQRFHALSAASGRLSHAFCGAHSDEQSARSPPLTPMSSLSHQVHYKFKFSTETLHLTVRPRAASPHLADASDESPCAPCAWRKGSTAQTSRGQPHCRTMTRHIRNVHICVPHAL